MILFFTSLLLTFKFSSSIATNNFILIPHPSAQFDSNAEEIRCLHKAKEYLCDDSNIPEQLNLIVPTVGEVSFEKKSFETIGGENDRDFKIWTGETSNENFKVGLISLVLLPNSELSCHIQIDHLYFKCKPCSLNGYTEEDKLSCVDMFLIDKKTMTNVGHKNMKADADLRIPANHFNSNIENNNRFLQTENETVIDIAVFYSNMTVSNGQYEDVVKADILTSLSFSNQVSKNQNLNIKFRIVYWDLYEYNETGDAKDAKDFIQSDTNINSIRNAYGADLIYFITSDRQLGYEYCSYGNYYNPEPYNISLRFYPVMIIDASCIAVYPQMIMVRFGYHLGCDVDYENSDNDQVIAYSYGYQSINCDFDTILGYSCEDSIQIPYFSSPDYKWAETGEVIGSESTANCARLVKENAGFVAEYMQTADNIELVTLSPAATSEFSSSSLVVEIGDTTAPTMAPTSSPTPPPTPYPTFDFIWY